jgi:hypothetical protein
MMIYDSHQLIYSKWVYINGRFPHLFEMVGFFRFKVDNWSRLTWLTDQRLGLGKHGPTSETTDFGG